MPTSTLLLIAKSLWPFLKEIVLKDKGLRDLLVENKVASYLSGCLLFLFLLFLFTTSLADKNYDDAKRLAQDKSFNLETIKKNEERIANLEAEIKELRSSPKPPETTPPVDKPATTDEPAVTAQPTPSRPKKSTPKAARTSDKQKVESNLKSYVESRYQKLGQDGN